MTKPALAALLLLTTLAAAADDKPKADPKPGDKVPNWEYANWSQFKPGTSVTNKSALGLGGSPLGSVMQTTLLEVADDQLVLESVSITKTDGKEVKGTPTKRKVPKEITLAKVGVRGVDQATGLPSGVTEEGKETLTVNGTEYECKWYKFKQAVKVRAAEMEVEGQVWVCDGVPGRQVKFWNKSSGGGFSQEATDVAVKK